MNQDSAGTYPPRQRRYRAQASRKRSTPAFIVQGPGQRKRQYISLKGL